MNGGGNHGSLPVGQAVALGLIQGPAEVLPVSSSGHLVVIPALLGWPYTDLDPELRKSFEVALHAGTALGLTVAMRRQVIERARSLGPRGLFRAAVTFAPAAAAGLAFERTIEGRLGGARTVALAQIAGGIGLWLADRRDGRRDERETRLGDAFAVGLGQAAALIPGISRGGGSLTVARLRGFSRAASGSIARQAALPVIAGASILKTARLRRRGLDPYLRAPFVAGGAAALGSTLASARLAGVLERDRSWTPVASYRVAFGAVTLVALRRGRRGVAPPSVARPLDPVESRP